MSLSESVGSFLVIQDSNQIDYVEKAQVADFETAISYARYGKFQRILLAVCGTIYATCAISTTTLSFVLPSAKCDFSLSSMDKGKLSAMPLIGMIVGCSVWGWVADAYGRKTAIMLSLLVDFVAAFTSSAAINFNVFLICRFFNGFGIIGATSLVFSYLGEFLSIKHRDVMLGRLEIFWNIGIILLPALAWSLLNKSVFEHFMRYENFAPWRIFVLFCSLPSLFSLMMLYFLPETPKFLISKEKYAKAKLVFQNIYSYNTGHPQYLYPVLSLEGEIQDNNNKCNNKLNFSNKMPLIQRVTEKLKKVSSVLKVLFSQPYLKYLGITCFVDFGLMASYYTLIMWFPEIFERFGKYEAKYPNVTAGVCVISQKRNEQPTNIFFKILLLDFSVCDASINNRVFLETILIGLTCIPTSISLSYFMKSIGKKYVLVTGLLLSGIATILLNWVRNSTETLILSCVFEAFTSVLETVVFCVVVDLFPTHLRAIALAATATCGRIGAICGNMVFGILIDLNCVVPIYLFSSLLIGSGIFCLGIPRSESYMVLH